MEVILNTRSGKDEGRISVLRTIATMLPGESWAIEEGQVQLGYAQVCCSRYARLSGKSFTVNSPASLGGQIIITRNR